MVKIKHHHLKKILVVVLAAVAIGLGVLIYKDKKGSEAVETTRPQSVNLPQTSPAGPVWTPAPGSEEEYLFSIRMDSPEEEKAKHYQYAISLAEEADFLNVTECKPQPLVLKVRKGDTIKFRNDGNAETRIFFDIAHTYLVAAKSTMSLKADFGNGFGLYGYGCSNSQGPVGMVLVLPN